jgi:hypothetical protein
MSGSEFFIFIEKIAVNVLMKWYKESKSVKLNAIFYDVWDNCISQNCQYIDKFSVQSDWLRSLVHNFWFLFFLYQLFMLLFYVIFTSLWTCLWRCKKYSRMYTYTCRPYILYVEYIFVIKWKVLYRSYSESVKVLFLQHYLLLLLMYLCCL